MAVQPIPNTRVSEFVSRRRLGWPSASALVVANMIGAGVFTTSGFALADLGRPALVLVAWVAGGILALGGALCYGALGRRFPESGGEYLFLSRTVHPLAGFLAGWVSLLAGFTAPTAAAALGLQAYLADFVGLTVRPEWIGTTAIVAAGLMHGLRLREGVLLQNAVVLVKLTVIVVFIGIGIAALRPELESISAFSGGVDVSAFAVTLVWISFSYSGWNAAVYVAGEIRDPERNLGRSLLVGTLGVTAIYLALNAIFVYAAPVDQLAGKAEVAAVAAAALGGESLRTLVSFAVALALFTSISAMVMAGPRVYAKMAEDGLFPRVLSGSRDAPTAAVAVQTSLAVAVVWSSGLAQLLSYIGFTLGVSAAATVAGLVALRAREGREQLPIPGYPRLPVGFIFSTLAIACFMATRQPLQAALGLATALVGLPVYAALRFVDSRSLPHPGRSAAREE